MGYRSDVRLLTTKKAWKIIEQKVREADPESCLLINKTKEIKGEYILFAVNDTKWYDEDPDFKDVVAFTEAVNDIIWGDSTEPLEFVRIGEDLEDTEYRENNGASWENYQNMPWLAVRRTSVLVDQEKEETC